MSVSEAGRMYKNDTHLRYPSRPLAGLAEKTRNPHKSNGSRDRKERKITSCWYCDKTAHGKLELTQPHSDSSTPKYRQEKSAPLREDTGSVI